MSTRSVITSIIILVIAFLAWWMWDSYQYDKDLQHDVDIAHMNQVQH